MHAEIKILRNKSTCGVVKNSQEASSRRIRFIQLYNSHLTQIILVNTFTRFLTYAN